MQKVLFLDDNPDRHNWIDVTYSGCEVIHCYTLDQFVDALETHDSFDVISLDHDLNDFDSKSVSFDGQEATGLDACGFLVNERFRAKMPERILIHSVNPCGAQNMRAFLQSRGVTVYWSPFCADHTGYQNG